MTAKERTKMYKELEKKVLSVKTKHRQGFTNAEMEKFLKRKFLKKYPIVNEEAFKEAMYGNTCMLIDEEVITYHCDLITALKCGIDNRKVQNYEWD